MAAMAYGRAMCGRYASTTPAEAVAQLFEATGAVPDIAPSWNVAPGQAAMVLRRHPRTGERRLDLLTWGLLPHWTADAAHARRPINARAETVARTPMFRDAFAARRAIVPADAFYEWQRAHEWQGAGGAKRPFAIARTDGSPLAFAALWEGHRAPDGAITRSFCIITTDANDLMRPIHDRMPVILEKADWPSWLGEVPGDPLSLLRPAAAGVLRAWPVGTRVNTPRNDGPELLEAV